MMEDGEQRPDVGLQKTEIEAAPRWRVKYSRGVQEDGGEGEGREVEMIEDEEQQPDVEIQEAVENRKKNLPAVRRSRFRVFQVSLGVLYLLVLAAVVIRYILVTLEKVELQEEVKKLKDEIKVNSSQLQAEVKKLKDTIEGKSCPEGWTRFGCSCYFKFTERKTWDESRKECQERGADLVIINNKEEQEFVRGLNWKGDSWIGLQHTEKTGRTRTWTWVDGSPLTETFWAAGHKDDSSWNYAVCCNDQGEWTQGHSYINNWICEK
ncbi:CD209 antigen-like protein E [Embiotoca jacksoni]|uniref:CD209 antigen-like protein E n=1 Tax=Embiotoca jacksoni TaxID=100190 RepID=UPI0037049979